MAAEQLNTVSILVFGALLGVVGTVFMILGGVYDLFRPFAARLWKSSGAMSHVTNVIKTYAEFLQWRAELESEGLPRSRSVASLTLLCLFCLVVLAIWLSPVKVEWIPFISAFVAGEFATIGLYEASRLRASRWTASPNNKE